MAHADCCLIVSEPLERDELLELMVGRLAASARPTMEDPSGAFTAIVRREEEACTAFGLGVAVPHCFLRGVGGPHLAIACCPQGIAFGARGGSLTHVVFLLVEDLSARAAHTALIARIARLCRDTALVRRLREARESAAVTVILAEEDAALD